MGYEIEGWDETILIEEGLDTYRLASIIQPKHYLLAAAECKLSQENSNDL